MADQGIIYLLWQDLVGITRTRGVPLRDLARRAEAGLGWAMAGQALTPFEDIVDNPWGPMDEARQIPDMATRFVIAGEGDNPDVHAVICDSRAGVDLDWECCVRSFCASALADLKAATDLDLVIAFEHEFTLWGDEAEPETPFSFSAARQRHGFLSDLERALTSAGIPLETIEPEFGLSQYEISTGPVPALQGADQAIISREVVREVARRHGLRASFTPKLAPDAVGNGGHLHLSFADASGTNVTPDPDGPAQLAPVAARFCAGILAHLDALVALTAPAPVSYHRLGPHHWSCGFKALGVQNREAALRIVPGVSADAARSAKSFNIEYRPIDAAASPYLALGALIRAGLEGIRGDLTPPAPITSDPADMSDEDRAAHGVTELPTTLGAALDALEADAVARGWFPDTMLSTYLNLKRWEVDAAETDPGGAFQRYARTY